MSYLHNFLKNTDAIAVKGIFVTLSSIYIKKNCKNLVPVTGIKYL